jgi:hypothetical protein
LFSKACEGEKSAKTTKAANKNAFMIYDVNNLFKTGF